MIMNLCYNIALHLCTCKIKLIFPLINLVILQIRTTSQDNDDPTALLCVM